MRLAGNMKSTAFILVFFCILILAVPGLPAVQESGEAPDASFGLGGSFGYFDIRTDGGGGDWEPGMVYGGGFVFEKMFTNRLGIHSGMHYQEARFGFTDSNSDNNFEQNIHMRSYAVPLYLITSANGRKVSLNLLTGLTFSHILKATFLEDTGENIPEMSVLQYLEYNQVALSAGLNLKFRIGRFTDFFIGGIGDFHISKFVAEKGDSDKEDHVYMIRGITGILFRTNLFPIADKSQ